MVNQPWPPPPSKTPNFYKQGWFVCLTLFFCFPIGLVLMWLYQKNWHIAIKLIISGFFAFIIGLAIAGSSNNVTVPTSPTAHMTPAFAVALTPAQKKQAAKAAKEIKQPRTVVKPLDEQASVSDFYTALGRKNINRITSMLKSNPKLANTLRPIGDAITPMQYTIANIKDMSDAAEDMRPLPQARVESVVKILLAYGADVNAKPVGAGRQTALHFAASAGYPGIVRLLIAHGAEVNAVGVTGSTPLHFAASNTDISEDDRLASVKVLVAHGADVNAKSEDGDTPLHLAADSDQLAIARFLISKGADVNAAGAGGETPVSEAIDANHSDMADFLRRHGGHE